MTFVFRIGLFIILYSQYPSIYLFIAYFIYEFTKQNSIKLITIFIILFIFLNIQFKTLPIGVVVSSQDDLYIHSFFSKLKIESLNNLKEGDVIYFEGDIYEENDKSYIKIDNFEVIFKTLKLRKRIKEHLNIYDEKTKIYLNKFLYNQNDYDVLDDVFLKAGFIFYILLRYLNRNFKLKKIIYVFLISVYSILFSFEIQFLYFLLTVFLNDYFEDPKDAFSISIIILYLLNQHFMQNYALSIVIYIRLLSFFDFKIQREAYLLILQSFLFQGIEPLKTIFYSLIQKIYILILFLSLVLLMLPSFETFYLFLVENFLMILKLFSFRLTGQMNLFCIISFLMVVYVFEIHHKYIQMMFIILILLFNLQSLSPIISFIDVGQGDSIYISDTFNQHNILIDTGSKYNYYSLKRFLDAKGVKEIDVLIISHFDEDHCGNLNDLQRDYRIKAIIIEPKSFNIGPFIMTALSLSKEEDTNANSLIYYLKMNNLSFLFTGDLPVYKEEELIEKYGPFHVDVLKVAHHGSNTSTSLRFLKMLKPHFAIISTNGRYNHPNSEVIDHLNALKIKTYITKDSKTISFKFNRLFEFIETQNGEFDIIRSNDLSN